MRWLLLTAMLAPASAAAQSVSLELPGWCTESAQPFTALALVRVSTDLDEVSVDGQPLYRRDDAFLGNVDLLPYAAKRPLIERVGDVELTAIAAGRHGVAAAKGICRIDLTGIELLAAGLPGVRGPFALHWADRFHGDAPHPTVIIREQEAASRGRVNRASIVFETWPDDGKLADLQVIVVVHQELRLLGVCPRCALDADSPPDEKGPCRRVREVGTVRAFEARTGRLLKSASVAAPPPPPCTVDMTYRSAETVIRDGWINEWLEGL